MSAIAPRSARRPARTRRKRKRASGRSARAAPIEYSLLLTATMCLLAFGVVMVFSASSSASLLGDVGDGAYYLKRTLMFGALGLVAMRLLSAPRPARDPQRSRRRCSLVAFVLLLATCSAIGTAANGAQRWIVAGPVQIQPSEIAKVALILYGAAPARRRARR